MYPGRTSNSAFGLVAKNTPQDPVPVKVKEVP
jgi:hypothetical protein